MDGTGSITLTNLELTRFFLAMVLLIFSTQSLGYLFHKSKSPKVVGEILGGLLLGPTLLGYFLPEVQAWLFNGFDAEGKLISLVSWLGLVLLMFVSGFEIERSFTKEDRRITVAFLLGATLVPLLTGLLITRLYDFSFLLGPQGNLISLALIISIAVSVTSIPIISKIFIDLGMINTRFAKIVLSIATVEDVILFAALAIATGIAGTVTLDSSMIAVTVLTTVAFFGSVLLIAPRLLSLLVTSRASFVVRSFPTRFALFVCLLFVALSSLVGVNLVFGAFLAGVAVGTMPQEIFRNARAHVRSICLALFTPVYFAVVGLKLDLIRQFDPFLLLGFLALSTMLKTAGATLVGKLVGKDWLSIANFAVALNARGGPGIVLATVAFDLGMISESFFVALVLTAIVTSILAGYWFRFVNSKGWNLLQD